VLRKNCIFAENTNGMKKVEVNALEDFIVEVFQKMGCSSGDSKQAADILVRAELRGISSHGTMRLVEYVNLFKNKRVNVNPDIKIINETQGTALIDGGKGFGLIVAPKAMRLAIDKAKNVGTGWVSVRNSYHFGIAGYFAMMALEHDMIGIAMTNANPLVAPTFSKEPLLGTNPIAVAVPAGVEPPYVADFATAPIARGKLDQKFAAGLQAPEGLLQNEKGEAVTDPDILSKGGAIKTLGGDKEHGGHKGYCMTSIVDILSAVLPGANFGPLVVPTLGYLAGEKAGEDRGIGHFFGAIRIDAFQTAEEFKDYMDLWIRTFRSATPVDGEDQVLIPGDPERLSEKLKTKEGIGLPDSVVEKLIGIADELGVSKKVFA
jgi:LDH2 family malate/lactate/ureidoglycolate dehydrogenase